MSAVATLEIVVTEWAPTQLELVEATRLARPTRQMDPDVMATYALEYARPDAAELERSRTPTVPGPPVSLADTAAEWERMWREV